MITILLRIIFGFFFMTGLSALIPFVLVLKLPEQISYLGGMLTGDGYFILVVAAVLIFISVFGVFLYRKTWSKTLFSLGLMSFGPGLISLLISFFGKKPLVILLSKIPEYDAVQSLAINYLDRTLPQLWYLTAAYISLGMILIYISYMIEGKDLKRKKSRKIK